MKTINRRTIFLVLCVAMLWCRELHAESELSKQTAAADELVRLKKWKEAASVCEDILKTDPGNGTVWHQLAMSRYSLGEWDAAVVAFQKSIILRDEPLEMFNLACVFALKGDKANAITLLARAINHKNVVVQLLNLSDPDLQALRDDPQFHALSEQVERAKSPCMFIAEARQFDFWIGEWDCFNPNGRKDGTSIIERFGAGCGILENWTGTPGNTGKSINFYDAVQGKWFQYWMGQDGVPVRLAGTFSDNAMHFEGIRRLPNGLEAPTRLTFTKINADAVRQFSETSADGGKTWTVNYDLKYVRKTKQPAPNPQ